MNMSTLWHDMKPSAATAIPDDRQSERVTRYAWKALAGSAIGYAMDGFDLLILGFTMLWAGTVMGMFVNGMVGGYGTLMSGAYPTAARATAQNVLWNLGRAVGGFGPIVVGALATTYSFQVAIALLASIYLLDILVTLFLIPELKGGELDSPDPGRVRSNWQAHPRKLKHRSFL
jgi:hypothetical protein